MSCSVTVAICTWNRATLLDQTLAEMQKMAIPPGVDWELLVVNNNCTDDTDGVLQRRSLKLPLRRVFEAAPGQSNARNAAISVAQGDLILWTDDDVLVDARWLAEYVNGARNHPGAAFFGGSIEPWFQATPPQWLSSIFPKVCMAYATREVTSESKVTFMTPPYGANFAIRRDIQRQFPYDPATGLRPGSAMRGDEVAVLRAVLASGGTGVWIPNAKVRHYIPKTRQTERYLREYFYGQGEAEAMQSPELYTSGQTLFGRPRWLLRMAIEAECRYRVFRHIAVPEVWVRHLIDASLCWGRISRLGQRRSEQNCSQSLL